MSFLRRIEQVDSNDGIPRVKVVWRSAAFVKFLDAGQLRNHAREVLLALKELEERGKDKT